MMILFSLLQFYRTIHTPEVGDSFGLRTYGLLGPASCLLIGLSSVQAGLLLDLCLDNHIILRLMKSTLSPAGMYRTSSSRLIRIIRRQL